MIKNYWLWSGIFLLASVPFAIVMLNRDMGAVPIVRVATFNAALQRDAAGQLLAELQGGGSEQAKKVAEVIQRSEVDILLLCELDRDDSAAAVDVFAEQYLAVSQNGAEPIKFEFRFAGPVNTGVPSGMDLDGDGDVGGPGDAFGFGRHPGHYGMAVLSRHPILFDEVRTFQKLLWSAMPDAKRPEGYYDDAKWQQLRLSSKSHWDIPIGMPDGKRLHLLCSHPTPPVFDGPEDRNGRRNHDEIRFWVDYLTPEQGSWIKDDAGRSGGLEQGARFAIVGDLNCDPAEWRWPARCVLALLQHPRVADVAPESAGASAASTAQWAANAVHKGKPELDTADFPDSPPGISATAATGPGNLAWTTCCCPRTSRRWTEACFGQGPASRLPSWSRCRIIVWCGSISCNRGGAVDDGAMAGDAIDYPSGPWIGFDQCDGHKVKIELELTFDDGVLRGGGWDSLGEFRIKGSYQPDAGEVRFTRIYDRGRKVTYRGFREAKGIWGTWHVGSESGGFHIWPL